MSDLDLDAIGARLTPPNDDGMPLDLGTLLYTDVPSLIARVRELEQQIKEAPGWAAAAAAIQRAAELEGRELAWHERIIEHAGEARDRLFLVQRVAVLIRRANIVNLAPQYAEAFRGFLGLVDALSCARPILSAEAEWWRRSG